MANRRTPVGPIVFPTTVEQISAGLGSVCAVLSNSTVRCWGHNPYGQLGDNSTVGKLTPSSTVAGLIAAPMSVSVGHSHACALLINGQVQCWGRNNWGQLGTGTSGVDSLQAASVVNLSENAVAISSGAHHSCVILQSGGIQCWGQNSGGKLGNNSNLHSSSPVNVQGLSGTVRSLSLGESQSCALTNTNAAFCWGGNIFGEIGDSSTMQRWAATPVSGMGTGVMALSAGDSHSCAVLTSGDVKCWGSDSSGQLGNGTEGSRTSPGTAVSLSGRVGVTTSIPSSTTTLPSANSTTGKNQTTGNATTGNNNGSTSGSTVNTTSSGTGTKNTALSGEPGSSATEDSSDSSSANGTISDGRVRTGTAVQDSGRLESVEERKLRLKKHADGLSNVFLVFAIVLVTSGSKTHQKRRRERPSENFQLFDFLEGGTTAPETDDEDSDKKKLKESFSNPRRLNAEDGSVYGLGSRFVGRLFRYEIFMIQTLSRFRIIRIGLRRWAEIALVSPVAAAMVPVFIFGGSICAALLVNSERINGTIAVSMLLLFSVAMPFFSLLAAVGWFVGRFGSSLGTIEQFFESLILVVGLGFAPLAMRALIGPTWKSLRRGLLAPTAVALAISYKSFRGWMSGSNENVATFTCRARDLFEDIDCSEINFNNSNLFELSKDWNLAFVIFALTLTSLVSLAAVWWSDHRGQPIQYLNRLHRHESPKYLLRREYAENVRVELIEGSTPMKLLQYVIAGFTMLFVLWDITGGWTISIVLGFLLLYFVLHTNRVQKKSRTIHPAIRAASLSTVVLGVTTLLMDHLVIGTVVLGAACLFFLFLRPRQLWS